MMTVPMTNGTNSLSEFENLICEEEGEVSDSLHGLHTDTATIDEMFIEGFHALYHVSNR